MILNLMSKQKCILPQKYCVKSYKDENIGPNKLQN